MGRDNIIDINPITRMQKGSLKELKELIDTIDATKLNGFFFIAETDEQNYMFNMAPSWELLARMQTYCEILRHEQMMFEEVLGGEDPDNDELTEF